MRRLHCHWGWSRPTLQTTTTAIACLLACGEFCYNNKQCKHMHNVVNAFLHNNMDMYRLICHKFVKFNIAKMCHMTVMWPFVISKWRRRQKCVFVGASKWQNDGIALLSWSVMNIKLLRNYNYTLWMILQLKFHVVMRSGLQKVCK